MLSMYTDDDNHIVLQPMIGEFSYSNEYINACYIGVSLSIKFVKRMPYHWHISLSKARKEHLTHYTFVA